MEPFGIDVPPTDVADLRDRLAHTRWPAAETVADASQGVPLESARLLCEYWANDYDWTATQQRLNELPQFVTTVDGVRLHLVHVRSERADAVPLVLTHGWPGSFLEFEATLPLLTAPPPARPAFHVVLPSLPGYAFSEAPREPGWTIHRIARAWCELMSRLGYARFVAAGSDWGTSVSTSIALQHPERLLGLHLVPPLVASDRDADDLTDAERKALRDLDARDADGSGYSAMHRTRPQTLGYGLDDSPAGLAAWIGEKLQTWTDGAEALTRDQMLDDISLYWFTRTATSSARLYWESIAEVSRWFTETTTDTIDVSTGCTVFPAEVPRPSRRWAQRRFPNIVHWGEPARGGHFGAWEQPAVFAAELQATAAALAR